MKMRDTDDSAPRKLLWSRVQDLERETEELRAALTDTNERLTRAVSRINELEREVAPLAVESTEVRRS